MKDVNSQWPECWQQLAVMIDAGITVESALRTLSKSSAGKSKFSVALRRTIGLVQRGQPLAKAFRQANCISKIDFTILNVAEKSGKLPLGLRTIARRRSDWFARVESLKAGLLLPKVVLIIGALVGVIVRTAAYEQSFLQALISVLIVFIIAWSFIGVTVRLIQMDLAIWLSMGWRIAFPRQRWLTYKLAYESLFYRLLSWQIGAGIAPNQSLNNCALLLSSKTFNRSVSFAARDAERGVSMPDILDRHGLVLSQPLKRVLLTSKDVGSWDQAVLSHLDVQQKVLSLKTDDFFKWLPRVYYLIVLLGVSKFMFV